MHSKFAGACSERLTLENIDMTAHEKGIGIIGTGDFTHPEWLKEVKTKLSETSNGVYKLKALSHTNFLLTSEVSIIFGGGQNATSGKVVAKDQRVKKVHNCIIAPNLEVVDSINEQLAKFGDLKIDGRPILTNISLSEFVEILRGIDKNIFIFPAHAWTPWYGIFGSFSGFNSMKDAYEDQAMHIHALETGLSSDPPMNWRVSALDKYTLISGSDAHSPEKIGREAVVFEIGEKELSYKSIIDNVKKKKLEYTVEFYPEEGKYHYDGHRNCNISLSPEEAKKYNNKCPVCRRTITVGVMHRVEELADREHGYRPNGAVPYVHAVPLQEIISYVSGKGAHTDYVKKTYNGLIKDFGSEFGVLLDSDIEKIKSIDKDLAKALENVRGERIGIKPGYDGVFGVIDLLNRMKYEKAGGRQSTIVDF